MDFARLIGRGTGKCYICGKSSKLPIHQNCGKKSDISHPVTRLIRLSTVTGTTLLKS